MLLAHVYDRLGRPSAALDRTAAVTAAGASGASPRMIYDTWPRAALDAPAILAPVDPTDRATAGEYPEELIRAVAELGLERLIDLIAP